MIIMLAYLIAAHAVCEYPLQGDFLSKAKNRLVPEAWWPLHLAYHALIHAVAVYIITGVFWFLIAEFALHAATDYSKNRRYITFNQDQFIHIVCKVGYVAILAGYVNV